ncbi:MAG: cytochrome C [Chloroflexi bacterium]|nr:cytochrome C [Chloroflexota bacterium]
MDRSHAPRLRIEPGRLYRRLLWPATVSIATGLTFLGVMAAVAGAQGPRPSLESVPVRPDVRQDSNESCLQCHNDPTSSMSFPSGEELPLYVDPQAYGRSAHGDWLDCVDCHQANRRYPHPLAEVSSQRDYSRGAYELCKRCHFENYSRTMDSIHFQALSEGKADAPICTDCHDPHTMKPFGESRTQTVKTCSSCHEEIYDDYVGSVHGSALIEENLDVPDCVTCHGVHNIGEASGSAFRQASVDLCAKCHANKEMMDQYNISSNVIKTYLDDFHGKTVGFYQEQSSQVWPDVAVCTDCHGVHDMKPVDDPQSTVIKENLLSTCRKCHADATANFPSAWLSHYEPSLNKASLVYLVKRYYQILIPLMVGGLALHIILDMWRLARNR